MAYREFTDADGVQWQAWEVIPSSAERRSAGERRFGAREERRERRVKAQVRVRMDESLAHGWLVFEAAGEKRRLSPIPAGWSELPDAELAALVRVAEVAGRPATG